MRRSLFVRLGIAAWSFVGLVVAATIVVTALATVSSVVLPLVFAAVLAVLFRPVASRLERRGFPPSLAAAAVLAGLATAVASILFVTERGIVSQASRIVDRIVDGLDELDVSPDTVDKIRDALNHLQPSITMGFVKNLAAGLSILSGFLVAVVLGALIMYYLLKDGPKLRRSLVQRASPDVAGELDSLISDACYVLRRYWLGRTAVAAVVAAVVGIGALALGLPLVLTIIVVTFVGGYVPYFGAVVAGALAVIVALGSDGLGAAVVMLIIVLIANLLVENLVEPAITGRTLSIHPLVVLLVTTVGGVVGGIVGLILAVPLTVIAMKVGGPVFRMLDVDVDAVTRTVRRTIEVPDITPPFDEP